MNVIKPSNSGLSIKRILSLLLFVMVSCAFITVMEARADITPNEGFRYPQDSAEYYDNSNSNYYSNIWGSAAKAWNNTGVFTWNQSFDSACPTVTSEMDRCDVIGLMLLV